MGIRTYRPYTSSTREQTVSDFAEITRSEPEKSLTSNKHTKQGRNNRGVITCRHRGGGHKRLYRDIDFRRDKHRIGRAVQQECRDRYRMPSPPWTNRTHAQTRHY